MRSYNRKFVGLTGTTCVGKSSVAVESAKRFGTTVISADSMQLYKGMDIGTAKITSEEMQGVPHFMLDVCLPNENYSSYLYQKNAAKIIKKSIVPPIVAGGTGFYFHSLLYPPEFGGVSEARHQELLRVMIFDGLGKLCEMLRQIDPAAYEQIDLSNPKRVMRAIEIAESGGSRANGTQTNRETAFDCKIFVLQRDRKSLYKQIENRVDLMIANGLVDEVKTLVDLYGVCTTSAFQAIGYKEIVEYLSGETDLNEAVQKIKLNTRHYAKRQISYFKRLPCTTFVDVDDKTIAEVAEEISLQLTDFMHEW